MATAVPAAADSESSADGTDIAVSPVKEHASSGASGEADERLAEITLKVKETLGVGNDYTSFYGDYSETEYGIRWQLNWNSEGESLNVQADENGKIYSMNLYTHNYNYDYKYYTDLIMTPSSPT
jgi:hypothetical protein